MPYASAAQARLFHAKAKTSKVWAKRAAHWDAATHAQGGIGKAREPDYKGQYRRQSHTLAALGGSAVAGGAGAGVIGALEHAGHDPMGFTRRTGEDWEKPALSAAARKRALRVPGGAVASHLGQAKTLGAVGAGALGLSALYHRRAKVAKDARSERRKSAILAGTTGAVGAAGVHLGARNYTALAEQVGGAGHEALEAHREDRAVRHGFLEHDPASAAYNRATKKLAARTVALKGPAALAAGVTAAAGGVGLYHALRGAPRKVSKGAGMRNYDSGNVVGHRYEEVAKADPDTKVKTGLAGLGLGAAAYKGGDIIQHGAAQTVRRAERRQGAAAGALARAQTPPGPSTLQRAAATRRGVPAPSRAVDPGKVAGATKKLATATRRSEVTGLRMAGLATRGRNVKLAGIGAAAVGTGALVSAMRKPKAQQLAYPGY